VIARAGLALAVGVVAIGAVLMRGRPAEIVASAPAPVVSSSGATSAKPTKLDGKTSIDEVGRAFVAALAAHDRAALEKLTPSYAEYSTLLYPDFVKAGEPLIGSMGLQWAWDNLAHASYKDLNRLMDELGGEKLTFESITTANDQPRGAASIYPKVLVKAKDESGKTVEIRAMFAIVARDGAFKVLRYRQNWD